MRIISLPFMCAAGAMDCSDMLTCGECRLVFSLSDIVSFIRHKQSTCRAGLQEPDHTDDDDDDDVDDVADRSRVNGKAAAQTSEGADDDKAVVRTNATEEMAFNFQDEQPSRLGSSLLLH